MSLQVWLPLNGDLHNQGLDNLIATNNGATINTSGKIGSCYSFDGSDDYISLSGSSLYNIFAGGQQSFSIAFWVYHADSSRAIIFGDYGLSGAINFNLELTTSHGIRFYWNGNPDKNFNSTSYVTASAWTHICVTYDGLKLQIYRNGILSTDVWSGTLATKNKTSGVFYLGRDSRTGATVLNGKLNDFRIYDHALSDKEVEEIAKGLVLHYKLDDTYIETTTNLITTQDGLSNTCYNGAISKYGYGENTDMYKIMGIFQDRFCTKVYMGTAGNAAYPYVYFDPFNAKGTEIQTLSFDYYPTIQNTLIAYSYNGTYNFSYTANNISSSNTNASQIIIPVNVKQWNHIIITAQKYDTTNTSRGIGYVRIGSASHTSTTTDYWLFANVQVENKDHATGYAGVGGSRTNSIIYDASGFCNNGTVSGTITISNDTTKYNSSVQMPSATTITHPCCLDNINQEWTCAAWVKPTTAGSYQNLNNFNSNNRLYHGTYPLLYLNSGTNDYYNYGNLALPANEWSHIAFVFQNSTGTKLIYINGENHTNMNGPNKTSTPLGLPNTVIIGGSYEGGLCDYREYATALTADQIKELYNTSMSIDNQGNIHTRELVEV